MSAKRKRIITRAFKREIEQSRRDLAEGKGISLGELLSKMWPPEIAAIMPFARKRRGQRKGRKTSVYLQHETVALLEKAAKVWDGIPVSVILNVAAVAYLEKAGIK